MSLTTFLQAMDEAALLAAGSKGLLVRAKKDIEAGRVSELEPGKVQVGDEIVILSDTSLDAAKCTCPATGICRHILASVLFLRSAGAQEQDEAPAQPIKPFALDVVEKFAGADWPRALAHLDNGALEGEDGSVTISFTETKERVVFPLGQELKQALYKGPSESRRRMCVAAAALVWAQAHGFEMPENIGASEIAATPETLMEAKNALEAASIALAAGTLEAARERLFSAAISTRAEAVPRLAAEMRGLARRMDQDALRRAEDTPLSLLMGLARSYALALALEKTPSDPTLVGTLARSFQPSGPRELGFIGAEWWQNPSGAKGFTAVFADLSSGSMHRAVHARAAGTDLSFRPEDSWFLPLWTLAPPRNMGARRLTLPDATLSTDGGLGLSQTGNWAEGEFILDDLLTCGAATRDFAQLSTRAESQIGIGLRQRGTEALAVIVPRAVHPAYYDDHQQKTIWVWEDDDENVVSLTWPSDGNVAQFLSNYTRKASAALIAYRLGGSQARLISLWLDKDPARSVQFEPLPKLSKLESLTDRFKNKAQSALGLGKSLNAEQIDPLRRLLDRSLEGVLSGLVAKPGLRDDILRQLKEAGLSSLTQLNEAWKSSGQPEDALRLGYALAVAQSRLEEVQ